jgi:hypothetical protein
MAIAGPTSDRPVRRIRLVISSAGTVSADDRRLGTMVAAW